jgi:hypothetical protein
VITYSREGDTVRLEMDSHDFDRLLLLMGYATGAAFKANDTRAAQSFLEMTNDLNRTNPNFIPYEVPEVKP